MTELHKCSWLLALVLLLVGCDKIIQPDLTRLYALQEGAVEQPPVILIHGLLGGRLSDMDTGKEEWPGGLGKLLFSSYTDLALGIDPQTLEPLPSGYEVTGITDKAAGRDFYQAIQDVLETAGGYQQTTVGTVVTPGEKRYYVFAYDWRQDNVKTVRLLDAFIENIRRDFGRPGLKVDIIAHSMGGMLTRYYLRYGTVDELTDNEFPVTWYGADRVRRAILLGTPNLGSARAINSIEMGVKIGLKTMPPEVVSTFPSAFQLMTHPLAQTLIDHAGEPLHQDQDWFDARFWEQNRFSIWDPTVEKRVIGGFDDPDEGRAYLETLRQYFGKHVERARRFVWSLTVETPKPTVRLIVFGGDCELTPSKILLEEENGSMRQRLEPKDVKNRQPGIDYERLMLEPGDGVVTKASLLARQALDPTVKRHKYVFFPIDFAFFLCVDHNSLTGNINFQDNLLHALLSVDR